LKRVEAREVALFDENATNCQSAAARSATAATISMMATFVTFSV